MINNIAGRIEPGLPGDLVLDPGDGEEPQGSGPIDTTGQLTLLGQYEQGVDGVLEIEIAGPGAADADKLVVDGDAMLDGTLRVVLLDDYEPEPKTTFEILTADSIVGDFAMLDVPNGFVISIEADRIVASFEGDTCLADIDGSGSVSLSDLLTVLASWGVCEGCPADLNDDGVVNIVDLLIVLAAWGPCDP